MRWLRASFGCALLACSSGGQLTAPDASLDATSGNDARSDAGGDASDAGATLGVPRVYVGSSDGSIHVYAFDDESYALTPVDAAPAGGNPSFLAFDKSRSFLYAVDESNSQVEAFSIDKGTGKLASLGAVSSLGQGPAYVALDRSDALVMVANYGGGTIAAFPRGTDGRLGDASATYSFGGGAHSHEIVSDPSNAFVLVPNLGLNGVGVFQKNGTALQYLGLTPAAGGPRHLAFDPQGAHAWVIDETASTIETFDFDAGSGALSLTQTTSSLLDASVSSNTGAEIQATNDGKHVLASNRGDDSIVVFDVDGSGKLAAKARVPTGGQTPRHFQIEETGRFLFVANQTSGTVVVMKMDATSGIPSPVGTPVSVSGPEFVGLVYLQ